MFKHLLRSLFALGAALERFAALFAPTPSPVYIPIQQRRNIRTKTRSS